MQFENQGTAKILQYDIASFTPTGPEVAFSSGSLKKRTVIHSPFQQTIRKVKWFSKTMVKLVSDCDRKNYRYHLRPSHNQYIDYLTYTALEWMTPKITLKNTPSSFTFDSDSVTTYTTGDTLTIGGVTTPTFQAGDTWTRGTSKDSSGNEIKENIYHYVPRDYQNTNTMYGASLADSGNATFDGQGVAGQHPQTTLAELFIDENLKVDLPKQRVSWTKNVLTNYFDFHYKINACCKETITGHDADNVEKFSIPGGHERDVHSQWRGNKSSLTTPIVAALDDSTSQATIESEKLCYIPDWSFTRGSHELGDKVKITGIELMNYLGNTISFEAEARCDVTDLLVCEREMMFPLSTSGDNPATENDRVIHLYLAGSTESIYKKAITPLDPVVAPFGRSSSIFRRVQRASESSIDIQSKEQVLIMDEFIEPIQIVDDPNMWVELYTTTSAERTLQRKNCENKITHGTRMETRYQHDVEPGTKASFELTEFSGAISHFFYGFINRTAQLGGYHSNYTNDPLEQSDAKDSVKDVTILYNSCDYHFKEADPELITYLQSSFSNGKQPGQSDKGYHLYSKTININTPYPAGCFNPGSNGQSNPIQSLRLTITSRPTVTAEQQLRNQLEQRDRVPTSDAESFEGILTRNYTGYVTAVLQYIIYLNSYELVKTDNVYTKMYNSKENILL